MNTQRTAYSLVGCPVYLCKQSYDALHETLQIDKAVYERCRFGLNINDLVQRSEHLQKKQDANVEILRTLKNTLV